MSHSRIDYSNIDENDLCLDDLDEDDLNKNEDKKTPNQTDNNNNKNLTEKEEDELLFKIPEPISSNLGNSIQKIDKRLEATLDNIFGADDFDDLESEEDFLIRTQPMFSSTQAVKESINPENFNLNESIIPIDINIQITSSSRKKSSNDLNNSIITTQSASELLRKKLQVQPTNNLNTSIGTIENESNIDDRTIWNYAQFDLDKKMANLGLDSDLLKKFSLDFYFKKVSFTFFLDR